MNLTVFACLEVKLQMNMNVSIMPHRQLRLKLKNCYLRHRPNFAFYRYFKSLYFHNFVNKIKISLLKLLGWKVTIIICYYDSYTEQPSLTPSVKIIYQRVTSL